MDHVDVIRHYAGGSSVDVVIANNNLPPAESTGGLDLIFPNGAWNDAAVYVSADLIDENISWRHDPAKLARTVCETYRKHRGKRRRMPRIKRDLEQPTLVAKV